MERVINTQLLEYLEEHQLICDRQYGFRHGRSAGDLLVYPGILTHNWTQAIESRGEALAVGGSVLSPTLFILHINDMLEQILSMHCYADDSTGDAHYSGCADSSQSYLEENRTRLVSEIELSLERVSDWGQLNLVLFNPSKTQVSFAFSAKRTPFVAETPKHASHHK